MVPARQYSKGLGEPIPEILSEIQDFSIIEKRDFSCCGEPAGLKPVKCTG
jgi:hypothetical protein